MELRRKIPMGPSFIRDQSGLEHHITQLESILLDFDGTLVDYYENEARALTKTLHGYLPHGTEIGEVIPVYRKVNEDLWKEYEKQRKSVNQVKLERFQMLIDTYKIDDTASEMNARYLDCFWREVVAYPNIPTILKTIKQKRPDVKLIILTNGTHQTQIRRSQLTKFDKLTDGLISSDLVGVAKPDPEIFEYTAKQFGLDLARSLVVGDSLSSDIQGACNVGIPSIFINHNGQSADDIHPEPDAIAASPEVALNYIANILLK